MATIADSSQITENLAKLSVDTQGVEIKDADFLDSNNIKYGLPLLDVYKLAVTFYRDKEGKAVHFSYEDKLQLVAFTQQVIHGTFTDAVNKLQPLGALDVVGRDRRLAWQKLGSLTRDQARAGFVELLSRKCPLFSTYIEAHRREKKEQERVAKEAEKKKLLEEEERQKKEAEDKIVQEQLEREESIKRQIQQALNEQTYNQFRIYAEQHYPGDPEKQGALVKQLQEQHYIQYMQQLQAVPKNTESIITKHESGGESISEEMDKTKSDESEEVNTSNNTDESQDMLVPASMWTRSDIDAFKKTVAQAEGDGVVRVGHGETVTVRVPTHQEGSRLFWEFATDHYDIGFGVYFEYGTPTTDQVSVHVSESEDEDGEELDDEMYEEAIHPSDLEAGSITINGITKPLLTEIVPVYRRDCQNEVYAGSHQYPGQGVYLLKFDNSYSLWRSKTLYYRVYYTQ